MTDQERAAMLAKAFQWLANGKDVEVSFSPLETNQLWDKVTFRGLCNVCSGAITGARLKPETITAMVTIPKPLKEWPADNADCWQATSFFVECVPADCRKLTGPAWDQIMQFGVIYATEKEAQQAMDAMRKFRTGELS